MDARQTQLTALRADIAKGLDHREEAAGSSAPRSTISKRGSTTCAPCCPEEKDAADLLRRMQTVATQSNLTIKSFKPAPTVTKQLHAEWPIDARARGHVPQPRDLLRPRRQVHAHRQHQRSRREGQGEARSERDDLGARASRRRSCCSTSRRRRSLARSPRPPPAKTAA